MTHTHTPHNILNQFDCIVAKLDIMLYYSSEYVTTTSQKKEKKIFINLINCDVNSFTGGQITYE